MARLEYIFYEPFDASLDASGELIWALNKSEEAIEKLPQIYWSDGQGWYEANVWAANMASSGDFDMETVRRNMKHLYRLATFIEAEKTDWRHFPVLAKQQVLRRFRKYLVDAVERGELHSSTASNCMNAVIRYYRFADLHALVGAEAPMWEDRRVVVPYRDTAGFKRRMVQLTTDLAISCRKSVSFRLEDGLLPIRREHMASLLAYAAEKESCELSLMLNCGFFTGARIGSIISTTVASLETAREDPDIPNVYLLPAGPGTDISTKFTVRGNLMVPGALLSDLRDYAYSSRRLLREAKAQPAHKDVLFLTRSGRPYTVGTVDRLIQQLRKNAVADGLHFMKHFRFHQTRATFGTWMMDMALACGIRPSTAIGFVRDAMFHKDEKTTWGYIRFLENVRAKQAAANEFTELFSGLKPVDWKTRVPEEPLAA